MCGIAGFVDFHAKESCMRPILESMMGAIKHRGPDDHGTWISDGVALGHQRLSILDLSSAGNQPMKSRSGRYILIFNGEIYNHVALRGELAKDFIFRGNSDTETLLELIDRYGLERALTYSVGMFALAIWDTQEHTLALARDRLGEKPLYYGYQNGVFLFGSELKALCAHPSFQGQMNWNSANTFLQLNFIPAPHTIYRDLYKLKPGAIITFTSGDLSRCLIPNPVYYWSLANVAMDGSNNPYRGSFDDAVDELDSLIRQSVRLQCLADVPVGAFLSGGIDSATVVAMMQRETSSKVTTFCIGMPDKDLDESSHAAAVAKYLGTNHIEHTINPTEVLELIPRLSEIWDEPFADSSQIPTFLVSQLARKHVGVVLSGDGGDEFFLGYSHYSLLCKLWKLRLLGKLPWNLGFNLLNGLSDSRQVNHFLDRSKFVVQSWRQKNPQELYRYWKNKYRHGAVPITEQSGVSMQDYPHLSSSAASFGLYDAGAYLPDDILVKVDRASMANSLETRAPLLDHRIVEFAFHLQNDFKLRGGAGKHILRKVLYRKIPKKIVDRPKMGFSIPLGEWLRGDLRYWAETLLLTTRDNQDFFDQYSIGKMWKSHLEGEKDYTEQLWAILSLLSFMSTHSKKIRR